MSSRKSIAAEEWEAHRSNILDFYINRKWPLKKVMNSMREHGLQASEQQYTRQFKKWGVSKYQKAPDWRYISKVFTDRHRQGKKSIAFINNKEIPQDKVLKEISRYTLPLLIPQPHTIEPMDHIRVCTPPRQLSDVQSTGSSQVTSQVARASRHHAVQSGQCLTPITLDNLPSLEFMDCLDLNSKLLLLCLWSILIVH